MNAVAFNFDQTGALKDIGRVSPDWTGAFEWPSDRPILVRRTSSNEFPAVAVSQKSLKERLFDALAEAKIWTSSVSMHLTEESKTRFFRQIDRLHDFDEWVDDGRPLNLASYKAFIRAVVYFKIDDRPSIALMPSGNLVALWRRGKSDLQVEFCPGDRVRWMVTDRIGNESEFEKATGVTILTRLKSVLAPYSEGTWFNGSATANT